MERLEIVAQRRTTAKGASKKIRQQGDVPGVLYGQNIENVFFQVNALDFKRLLSKDAASQLVYLKFDDGAEAQPILVREIQRDVLTGAPTHVDFLSISMTEKITSAVRIIIVGESESVTMGIGILLQGANTVEVECLAGDLPPSLEVDISNLQINESLYISDLNAPHGVTIISDPQEMVVQIVHEKLAEVEEEEEGVESFIEESATVEVITRGRDEEE
jgi:large subunit ribosomal protein L25